MLLANLAKVGRIVGAMVRKAIRPPARDARNALATMDGDEDLGERIIRADLKVGGLTPQPQQAPEHHHRSTQSNGDGPERKKTTVSSSNAPGVSESFTSSASSSPKPRKRRCGRANAIQELFHRLG